MRVIPYSTLSFSTQSYRVRLRAVISYVQNIQFIYKKREELLWTHLIYECRINNVISNFIIFGILILKFFCSSAHCIIICCARGYQYNIWGGLGTPRKNFMGIFPALHFSLFSKRLCSDKWLYELGRPPPLLRKIPIIFFLTAFLTQRGHNKKLMIVGLPSMAIFSRETLWIANHNWFGYCQVLFLFKMPIIVIHSIQFMWCHFHTMYIVPLKFLC